MKGLPTSCGYRGWKWQGRGLGTARKLHPYPKGWTKPGTQKESWVESLQGRSYELRLRVAASGRCSCRERGRKTDTLALLFYRQELSCLDFPLAETKQKSESKRSHWCSPYRSASQAKTRVKEGWTVDLQRQEKYLAQKRFLSDSRDILS